MTTTPMTALTIERLAFVRFLFNQGLAQATQPEPFSATAVLSFHDAVEQFLRLAADHAGITLSKGVNFSGYWKELASSFSKPLPSQGAMERLNDVRVKFKHHGVIPSKSTIEQFRSDTTTFFTDATPVVFGVNFDNVDMISLVARTETASMLRDAQTHADAGDLPSALAGLMIAFTEMLDYYSDRREVSIDDAPFSFGPTLHAYNVRPSNPFSDSHRIHELTIAAVAMQRAMRMMALGIDYNSYSQFETLAPRVDRYMDMSTRFIVMENHRRATNSDYQFSRNFVIESAIKAARADAALQRRRERREANSFADGSWPAVEEREWTGPAN